MPKSVKEAYLKFKVDSTQYDRSLKDIIKALDILEKKFLQLQKVVSGLQKNLDTNGVLGKQAVKSTEKARKEFEKLFKQTDKVDRKLQDVRKTGGALGGVLDKQSQKVGNLKDKFLQLDQQLKYLRGALHSFSAAKYLKRAIGAVGESLDKYEDFTNKIAEVSTLLPEKVRKNYQGVFEAQARALSQEMGFDPKQLAQGFYDMVSAGVDAQDAMEGVRRAAELAKAGNTDLASGVDILTSVMNANGSSVKDSSKYMDVLFKTVEQGKTTIKELSSVQGQLTATAKTVNIAFDEQNSQLALLTTRGIKTRGASKSLIALYGRFSQTAFIDKAKIAFSKYNMEIDKFFDTTTGKIKDFNGFISAMGKLPPLLQKQLITGKQAQKAFNILSTSMDDLKKKTDAISFENAGGAAKSAFNTVNATAKSTSERLKQVWNELVFKFTEAIGKIVTPIKKMLIGIFEWFNKLSKPVKAFIVTFVGLAAVIPIVLGLTKSIGLLISSIKALGIAANMSFGLIAVGVVAVAGVVAGLVAIFSDSTITIDEFNKSLENTNKELEKTKQVDDLIKRYNDLRANTNRTKKENEELSKTIETLRAQYPNLAAQMEATGKSSDDFVNAIDRQNKKLQETYKTIQEATAARGLEALKKNLKEGMTISEGGGLFKAKTSFKLDFTSGQNAQEQLAEWYRNAKKIADTSKLVDIDQVNTLFDKVNSMLQDKNSELSKKIAENQEFIIKSLPFSTFDQVFKTKSGEINQSVVDFLQTNNQLGNAIIQTAMNEVQLSGNTEDLASTIQGLGRNLNLTTEQINQLGIDYINQTVTTGNLTEATFRLAKAQGVSVLERVKSLTEMSNAEKKNLTNFIKNKIARVDAALDEVNQELMVANESGNIKLKKAEADDQLTKNTIKNAEIRKKSLSGELTEAEKKAVGTETKLLKDKINELSKIEKEERKKSLLKTRETLQGILKKIKLDEVKTVKSTNNFAVKENKKTQNKIAKEKKTRKKKEVKEHEKFEQIKLEKTEKIVKKMFDKYEEAWRGFINNFATEGMGSGFNALFKEYDTNITNLMEKAGRAVKDYSKNFEQRIKEAVDAANKSRNKIDRIYAESTVKQLQTMKQWERDRRELEERRKARELHLKKIVILEEGYNREILKSKLELQKKIAEYESNGGMDRNKYEKEFLRTLNEEEKKFKDITKAIINQRTQEVYGNKQIAIQKQITEAISKGDKQRVKDLMKQSEILGSIYKKYRFQMDIGDIEGAKNSLKNIGLKFKIDTDSIAYQIKRSLQGLNIDLGKYTTSEGLKGALTEKISGLSGENKNIAKINEQYKQLDNSVKSVVTSLKLNKEALKDFNLEQTSSGELNRRDINQLVQSYTSYLEPAIRTVKYEMGILADNVNLYREKAAKLNKVQKEVGYQAFQNGKAYEQQRKDLTFYNKAIQDSQLEYNKAALNLAGLNKHLKTFKDLKAKENAEYAKSTGKVKELVELRNKIPENIKEIKNAKAQNLKIQELQNQATERAVGLSRNQLEQDLKSLMQQVEKKDRLKEIEDEYNKQRDILDDIYRQEIRNIEQLIKAKKISEKEGNEQLIKLEKDKTAKIEKLEKDKNNKLRIETEKVTSETLNTIVNVTKFAFSSIKSMATAISTGSAEEIGKSIGGVINQLGAMIPGLAGQIVGFIGQLVEFFAEIFAGAPIIEDLYSQTELAIKNLSNMLSTYNDYISDSNKLRIESTTTLEREKEILTDILDTNKEYSGLSDEQLVKNKQTTQAYLKQRKLELEADKDKLDQLAWWQTAEIEATKSRIEANEEWIKGAEIEVEGINAVIDARARLLDIDEELRKGEEDRILQEFEHSVNMGEYEDDNLKKLSDEVEIWQAILEGRKKALQEAKDNGKQTDEFNKDVIEAEEKIYALNKAITEEKKEQNEETDKALDKEARKLLKQRQELLLMQARGKEIDKNKMAYLNSKIQNKLIELGFSEEDIAREMNIPAFAEGGFIPSNGLIKAHSGEFVLNKDAVKALGLSNLKAINDNPFSILNGIVGNNSNMNVNVDMKNNINKPMNVQQFEKMTAKEVKKIMNNELRQYGKNIKSI